MRVRRLLLFCWLLWLAGCGAVEPVATARPRAEQVATATAVALASEATQAARAATATAQAQPTATATPTEAPTATPTRTPTQRPPTATPMPTRTPQIVPTRTPQIASTPRPGANGAAGGGGVVLADDDLTRPGHGWITGPPCKPGELQQLICSDGNGLHLLFPVAGRWGRLWNDTLPVATDVRVDLTARVMANPEGTGGYGILCRWQRNGDGYILRVWADGRYAVYRMAGGYEVRLGGSGEIPSPHVITGLAENQLHFECVGNTFVIAVNGHELLRVEDDYPELNPGDVALYGCTCRGGTLDVAYSHVRVISSDSAPGTAPPRALPTRVSQAPPPLRETIPPVIARRERFLAFS